MGESGGAEMRTISIGNHSQFFLFYLNKVTTIDFAAFCMVSTSNVAMIDPAAFWGNSAVRRVAKLAQYAPEARSAR